MRSPKDYAKLLQTDRGSHSWDDTAAPHLRMWAAVLYQGVFDYCKCLSGRNEREYTSAKKWVESPNTGGCSYLWICGILGINAYEMRRKLLLNYARVVEKKLTASHFLKDDVYDDE